MPNDNEMQKPKAPIQLKHWRAPGDHPYADLTRTWLKEGNVDPAGAEKESDDHIYWNTSAGDGMSIVVAIYKDKNEEMFFKIEAAISQMNKKVEAQVTKWLAQTNANLYFPFRLALMENDGIIVQCRSYCDGFTPEHFKLRLETLIPFATNIQNELKMKFGLPSYIQESLNIPA